MQPTIQMSQVLDIHGRPFYLMATGPRGDMVRGVGWEPYKGASGFRKAGERWGASWGSPDTDFLPAQEVLRARSRQLIRNNPLAAGALQTLQDNVIGPGLRVKPEIDREILGLSDDEAENVERQFLRIFNEWAESQEADLSRTQDFYQLQQLAYHSSNESGDILCLAPTLRRPGARLNTRVQLIEADRLSNPYWQINTPTLVGGVQIDEATSAPTAFHIQTGHPGGYVEMTSAQQTWTKVQAFGATTGRKNCWLLYHRKRPAQHRGVPYLATVLEQLKQIERYTDQEIQAAIVGGSFTVFVKSPTGEGLMPLASTQMGGVVPTSSETEVFLDYGGIVDLAPGEDVSIADPKRPNTAFDAFIQSLVQQIGSGTGIPYELLGKHFKASYSASRAALLEAWKFFRPERVRFASSFCQPYYELVLTEAIARGYVQAPGFLIDLNIRRAYLKASWIGPVPGQLNPLDEVNAAEKRINIGISTIAREALEANGSDWETNHAQRKKEVTMRRDDGMEPYPVKPPLQDPGVVIEPAKSTQPSDELPEVLPEEQIDSQARQREAIILAQLERTQVQLSEMFATMRAMATRPAPSPQPVHVTVQPPDVQVHMDAPHVNIEPQPVNVNVQPSPPAQVHFQPTPEPIAKKVTRRVERDKDGNIARIVEE